MSNLKPQSFIYTKGLADRVDVFSDLVFTATGNLLVSGYGSIGGISVGGSDLHLSLRDYRGRVIWQSNFGTLKDDAFLATAIIGNYAYAVGFVSSQSGTDRDAVIAIFANVDIPNSDPTKSYKAGDLIGLQAIGSRTTDGNSINPTDEQFNDIAITPAGDIVLVGFSRGDGTIGGVAKSNAAPTNDDRGNADGVLFIITANKYITKLVGASGNDTLESVAVIPSGSFAGTILAAGQLVTSSGDIEAYLAAYNSSGEKIWEQVFGAANNTIEKITSVVCDANKIYVAGTTSGDLSKVLNGQSAFGTIRDSNRIDSDPFIAAFDFNGKQLWLQQLDNSSISEASVSLALGGNRLELLYGDGLELLRASFNSDGKLISYETIASGTQGVSGSQGIELPEAIATDQFGNVVLAGSSNGAWPDRYAGGIQDALLHFSGPQFSSYQIDIEPLNSYGDLQKTFFDLDPGAGNSFAPGKYAALTGYVSIENDGRAIYEPYPELPVLYTWSSALHDTISVKINDSNNQLISTQELLLRVAASPAKSPIYSTVLRNNSAVGLVSPFGLGRPEILLTISDDTYTTTSGAEKKFSIFDGNQASVTLQLAVDKAPITALNALRYAREGLYDNSIFHRIIDGFMVQGGGFDVTKPQPIGFASSTTFAPIPLEGTSTNGLSNQRGTVAMARTSYPHSASNQFFVNLADNSFLNDSSSTQSDYSGTAGYSVFGVITDGMEIFDAVAKAPKRYSQLGSNDSNWGSKNSGALFENITDPIVVIKDTIINPAPLSKAFNITTKPLYGSVNLDPISGGFIYRPNSEYKGKDQFTVRVLGGGGSGLSERSIDKEVFVTGSMLDNNSVFNLDVNSDGKLTVENDGLMIARKLFGFPSVNQSLSPNPISPGDFKSEEYISDFINKGFSNGALDLDRDGKISALGDGLMLLRYMSNPATSHSSLVRDAIGYESPYFGKVDNFSLISLDLKTLYP